MNTEQVIDDSPFIEAVPGGLENNQPTEIGDPAKLPARPLVSVQMITYNHEPFLAQAIEGVISQKTNFPFELVIGEDCSTDQTRQVALDYQARYPHLIRVLYSAHNVGMFPNVRRVHTACRGKYLAYCEGDDYWNDPHKLQEQVEFLETHPDYALVHTAINVDCGPLGMNASPGYRRTNQGLDPDDRERQAYYEILMNTRWVCTASACFRHDLLNQILRDCPECSDPVYMMGDTQRWLELARLGRIKFIPKPMATYRITPNSATHQCDKAKRLKFELNTIQLLEHYLTKYDCPEPVKRAARACYYYKVMRTAFKVNNREVFNRLYDVYRRNVIRHSTRARLMRLGINFSLLQRAALCLARWQAKRKRVEQ